MKCISNFFNRSRGHYQVETTIRRIDNSWIEVWVRDSVVSVLEISRMGSGRDS